MRVLLELDSKTYGLLILGASAFGSFAAVSFRWLLFKFKANEESFKEVSANIKELDRKIEKANQEVLDVLKKRAPDVCARLQTLGFPKN